MNLTINLYAPMSVATADALRALSLAASEDMTVASEAERQRFRGDAGSSATPPTNGPTPAAPEPEAPKTARKSRETKPAPNPQTIEGTATVVSDDITVEQARERMKQFAGDGHMDQVSAALEEYGVKKVSDVPSSTTVQNATFAGFVATIEKLVKAKG